jgi:DNA-binding NarL/FixJ family response regulator
MGSYTAIPFDVRSCSRCGVEFKRFDREHICPTCRRPQKERKPAKEGQSLSARERQVVDLVERGLLNKQIAFELHLAEGTIKELVHRILRKTGLDNRVKLAIWSFCERRGIAA